MIKAGFSSYRITPRVGVSMAGFGPFINRNAVEVRDHLEAKAAALTADNGGKILFIVCDLCTLSQSIVDEAKAAVCEKIPELTPDDIIISATHTHSAPAVVVNNTGWGTPDLPYISILPYKIAAAGIQAWQKREEIKISTAYVECRHIGLNRVYDIDKPPLEEVLREDWEPAHPELTDTMCRVIRFDGQKDAKLKGFFAYFGCHCVCCCQETHRLHGDFSGLAMRQLMRENPGSIGIFMQGAEGDVNTGCVHKPEPESLLALDVFASRFANAVRKGLQLAELIPAEKITVVKRVVDFSTRKSYTEEYLKNLQQEVISVLHNPEADDSSIQVRFNAIYQIGIAKMLEKIKSGSNTIKGELFGVRLGELEFLCTPFEVMQAIKNDVVNSAKAKYPMVLSLCNGALGYAPDQKQLDKHNSYEDTRIPLFQGRLPYADIHRELVKALLEIDGELSK